jgi:hypothetical protein
MPKPPLASFRSTDTEPRCRTQSYPDPHWLRSVPRTLNLGVGLNLTQTPIGFVPFHGHPTSASDSILPRPPLASFRSTGTQPRCRTQSYPDPHWLRSVPRTLNLGVGLNLTQTPIGFVPFHGHPTSASDSILPRPPLASFRSTGTQPRRRTRSYPDPHWLRFVPRTPNLGVGLDLTQTHVGFVSLR